MTTKYVVCGDEAMEQTENEAELTEELLRP